MSRVLVLDHLVAGYDRTPVVRDLSLVVDEGEVVALLGPNGAGKTTTLLTISGLLSPLGGSLDVLGQGPPSTRRPHTAARRGVAHVPEDRSIFTELTVAENLRVAGADSDEVVSWFPAIEPLLHRQAGLLSGGEQQMLALGRALGTRPRLVLVDELSLGLAPLIVEGLLAVLRRVADERGVGIVVVEQHVHLVLEMADRAYVLSHGQLVLEGRASDLADRSDLMAASYLDPGRIEHEPAE
jgi:branched-chain amino acid transport system ATP-binding protein